MCGPFGGVAVRVSLSPARYCLSGGPGEGFKQGGTMRIQNSQAPLSSEALGRIAYDTLRGALRRDAPEITAAIFPPWEKVAKDCREAYCEAAGAVRAALIVDPLDERKHRFSLMCQCPDCLDFASQH